MKNNKLALLPLTTRFSLIYFFFNQPASWLSLYFRLFKVQSLRVCLIVPLLLDGINIPQVCVTVRCQQKAHLKL